MQKVSDMSSVVLGITDGDDGGAALLVDGRCVAAVNEERLNRMKMSVGFPFRAITEVLNIAKVSPEEVTHVGVAAHIERFKAEAEPYKGWFTKESAVDRVRNYAATLLSKPLGNNRFALNMYRSLKRASNNSTDWTVFTPSVIFIPM